MVQFAGQYDLNSVDNWQIKYKSPKLELVNKDYTKFGQKLSISFQILRLNMILTSIRVSQQSQNLRLEVLIVGWVTLNNNKNINIQWKYEL